MSLVQKPKALLASFDVEANLKKPNHDTNPALTLTLENKVGFFGFYQNHYISTLEKRQARKCETH